jgi:hypothetical protein
MFRIIQGEKGQTGEKKEFDPEFDQNLESQEFENAQQYRFRQLSFKQKLREMRGKDVPQWTNDTIKMAMNFHIQYHEYEERTSHLKVVLTEYND